MRVIHQFESQVALSDKCNISLEEEDMVSSMRLLNQSRRRAMRLDCTTRCASCTIPLFMLAPATHII